MQGAFDCTSESNGITCSDSSTRSRDTCDIHASIEILEILIQDSPGLALVNCIEKFGHGSQQSYFIG